MRQSRSIPEATPEALREEKRRIRLGLLVALGAALSYALGQVLSRKVVADDVSPQTATFFALLFGTLLMAITNGRQASGDLHAPRRAYVWIFLAGLCSSAGVMGLFFALNEAPVVYVSPIIALNPLVAMILSAIFLQRLERVTPRMLAGGVLVVLGAGLVALGASQ